MATFVLRQSIEGDQVITAEGVENTGVCWVDGDDDYISNQLVLVINSIYYPISIPRFIGLGYIEINVPDQIILKANDVVKLISACSSDESLPVNVLSINLTITTHDATTCSDDTDISVTYSDWVRLFFRGGDTGDIVNIFINSLQVGISSFHNQVGYGGDITSPANNWRADADENVVLFSNVNYQPETIVDVKMLTTDCYFTIRLGYVELLFVDGQIDLIDYVSGGYLGSVGGGFAVNDIISFRSIAGAYIIRKNSNPAFYTAPKTIEYILQPGHGTVSPNPSVAGSVAQWNTPAIPGNYLIQVKLGSLVTAQAYASVESCKFYAFPKSTTVIRGTNGAIIPPLSSYGTVECTVLGYKILSLPSCGTLKYDGVAATIGQTFIAANADKLTIDVPANCLSESLIFNYSAYSNTVGCIESDPALVTVALINPTAQANQDNYSAQRGDLIVHNVLNNDVLCSQGSTFIEYVQGSAQNGEVTDINPQTGEVTFEPDANFIGTASYRYNLRCGGSYESSIVISSAMVIFSITADCDVCKQLADIKLMLKNIICNQAAIISNG